MSTVIRVEHLSKQYRLGMIGGATLREDLSRWWALRRGKPDPLAKVGSDGHKPRIGERFWALKDVSFEVKQGEVLGIIGRNGAGKSTLLKILSRITAPTEGVVKIKGRIGSLLEVGTGFHPELTGRENIYLNGAILGMSRREVTKKLDEIIAFSEVEQFIDTPVKRYSSGMYVRLAFAVAAHLDPEILIVDEVLAVGDAAFQKKCLGKMSDVAREGRTVLFVSHNMAAVRLLCTRALRLTSGVLISYGETAEVVQEYLSAGLSAYGEGDLRDHPGREPGSRPWITGVSVGTERNPCPAAVPFGEALVVRMFVRPEYPCAHPHFAIGVTNQFGERVCFAMTRWEGADLPCISRPVVVECKIDDVRLLPGTYSLRLVLGDGTGNIDAVENAVQFQVAMPNRVPINLRPGTTGHGVVVPSSHWRIVEA